MISHASLDLTPTLASVIQSLSLSSLSLFSTLQYENLWAIEDTQQGHLPSEMKLIPQGFGGKFLIQFCRLNSFQDFHFHCHFQFLVRISFSRIWLPVYRPDPIIVSMPVCVTFVSNSENVRMRNKSIERETDSHRKINTDILARSWTFSLCPWEPKIFIFDSSNQIFKLSGIPEVVVDSKEVFPSVAYNSLVLILQESSTVDIEEK